MDLMHKITQVMRRSNKPSNPKEVLEFAETNPSSLEFLRFAYNWGFISYTEMLDLRGKAIANMIGGKSGK